MPRGLRGMVLGLVLGTGMGWVLADSGRRLEARNPQGEERSQILSGPIAVQDHPTLKVPLAQDALYYLDYRKGRLLASVPSFRQTGTAVTVQGAFASRDLVADFRLPAGITPRFEMTVGHLGASGINGWSPLFVVETATRRMATYRVEPAGSGPGGELAPRFELMELRTLP